MARLDDWYECFPLRRLKSSERTSVDDSLLREPSVGVRMAGSGRNRRPYFSEKSVASIRRTEVRPIFSRRAISALLTPARWSLRIRLA